MKLTKKQKALKAEVDNIYKEIGSLNGKLLDIRESCDHPVTEKCTYSWAVGHGIENAEVCSICGELITKPNEINFIREYDA